MTQQPDSQVTISLEALDVLLQIAGRSSHVPEARRRSACEEAGFAYEAAYAKQKGDAK
jgi:hypothetical protein